MAIPRRVLAVRLATPERKVAGSGVVPPYPWKSCSVTQTRRSLASASLWESTFAH
jgi:hypothetical protein